MHIPDGFVSVGMNLATAAASMGVCGLAVARARRTLGEKQVPLLAITAAFLFAAQMINFPLIFVGMPVSGHLMGGVLAAVLLGPLNSFLAMAVVLTIQCLMFNDGGLTALGSNLVNMGIVGSIGGYWLFRALKFILPRSRAGFLTSTSVAAWASVVAAAGCCAVELGLSGTVPLRAAMTAMIGVHALIGVGEAVITTAVLSTVLATRPDLVPSWDRSAALQAEEA